MQVKKQNGGSSKAELELDHELPPAENGDEPAPQGSFGTGAPEDGGSATTGEDVQPESELERIRAERAAYLDLAARLQAEFDNFRKRSIKAQQEYKEYALADALTSLLPILDSLDNALKTKAASLEDFHAGIELIDKQFHDLLAKLGVQPVPTEGEPFNPNLHQAIQVVETDKAEDNHVLDELQRGYKLKDRLLRPAMVRVARNAKS